MGVWLCACVGVGVKRNRSPLTLNSQRRRPGGQNVRAGATLVQRVDTCVRSRHAARVVRGRRRRPEPRKSAGAEKAREHSACAHRQGSLRPRRCACARSFERVGLCVCESFAVSTLSLPSVRACPGAHARAI
eukprot:1082674-Pleurochrysis_carterae.AAC.5